MARPKNEDVEYLSNTLNISRDYARKILNSTRPLTAEHEQKLNGLYGGKLLYLTAKYGFNAEVTPAIIEEELHIHSLADLAELLNK